MKKKTIAASLMSIALCASVATGATYALFTSESNTNIAINAGKVEVVATIENVETYSAIADAAGNIVDEYGNTYAHVLQADNVFANQGTVTEKEGTITLDRMTPGDKVSFEIAIANNSNVTIQYRTLITDVDNGLLDALVITVDGETYIGEVVNAWTVVQPDEAIDSIEVSIELPMTAGNEWQDKKVDLAVAVEAVQGNANTVQEPLVFDADTAYTLTGLRANGSNGVLQATAGTLTVNGNGTVNAEKGEDEYAMAVWANGGNVVINGGSYVQNFELTDTQYDLIYASNGGDITIYGGTFKSVTPDWTLNCRDNSGSTITVMGGRFYKFDPSKAQTGEGEITVPDGCEVVENGDWYEVVRNFYENEKGEYVINNAKGLKCFAETVNAGNNYEGKTVLLNGDVDLANEAWTAISSFAGTFDGQKNTISNLKNASLFGAILETGVVTNVNLKDVSANTTIGGFLATNLDGSVAYCTVTNATATTNTYGVSGMIGFAGVTAVIDHCSVDGYTLTVTNTDDNRDKVGGLVGQSSGANITSSSVSNITLNGIYKTKEWGGFVGRHANESTIDNCTATNVTINVSGYAQSVGGFVGGLANATIKGCDVNGVTINIGSGGHIGGFCGYTGQVNWYTFEDCRVTGLSITLNSDSVGGVGGFIGRAAFTTTIKNCSAEGVIDASDVAIATGLINELIGQNYPRTEEDGGLNPVVENNNTDVTIK